jgi:hypothetical protein
VHAELAGHLADSDDRPVPAEHVEDGEAVQQRADRAIAWLTGFIRRSVPHPLSLDQR